MTDPRVAYILLWFPEPSQTFILNEVNTLVRLGLDVRVYTLYGSRPATRLAGMAEVLAPVHHLGTAALKSLVQALLRLGRTWGPEAARFLRRVAVRRWRSLETAGEALWAVLAGVHLARRFKAEGIDRIHAPWADGPATAAWVASTLTGIPFSFGAHAQDIFPPDGALQEKMAAAVMVRAMSDVNRRYLQGMAPGDAAKVVRLRDGVPLAAESRLPAEISPPFHLLALGRLVFKKGFHVLLESCRQLAAQGLDFRLTLAGDGPDRRKLLRLVSKYGLEGRVTLPGFISHREVPGLFRQAHLFVMPCVVAPSGDRDGIPTVILEALLHEVPVVASAVAAIPEVIHPGETGWLVPPSDPEAITRAVLAALADPGEARRRALAGRALVAREFDSRNNYARLKALFEEAAGPHQEF